MSNQTIKQHEGSKYLKRISSPVEKDDADRPAVIHVDVYAVLEAFDVSCPAIAHCLKKLLMPGQRGKGSIQADLKGAMAALNRAIELQDIREGSPREHIKKIPIPDPRKEGPEELKARLEGITGGIDEGLEKIATVAGIGTKMQCEECSKEVSSDSIIVYQGLYLCEDCSEGTKEPEEEEEVEEVTTKDSLRKKIQKMMTKSKEDKKLLDPPNPEEPRYPEPTEEGE